MCPALLKAYNTRVITEAELNRTLSAIGEYMNTLAPESDVVSMARALRIAGHIPSMDYLTFCNEIGVEFYKNWNNRPGK